jgi:hypothetical protein
MKKLLLFVLTAVGLVAQDLAPDSIANHVANFASTGNGGSGTGSFSLLFTASQSYRMSGAGNPLNDPLSYTWTKTGPNTATLVETEAARTITSALTFTAARTASFRTTSNNATAAQEGVVTLSSFPQPAAPLLNISTRATLANNQVLTPGFVVGGTVPRRVLVRAIGPTLGTAFNIPNSMSDPSLTVFRGATQIATNNDWGGGVALTAVFTSVGAFALPVSSLDAALVLTLAPGNYTAQVRGTGSGEVIVEVYFVD